MIVLVVVTAIVIVSVFGDYFLKLASEKDNSFVLIEFWSGAFLYLLTAAGWVVAMRYMSLASLGVYYAMLTILLMTALGVLVFKESLSFKQILGIALAITSMTLMTQSA